MRKTGDYTPKQPEYGVGATDSLIVFGVWVVRGSSGAKKMNRQDAEHAKKRKRRREN